MNGRLVGALLLFGSMTALATACTSSDNDTSSAGAAAPYEAGAGDSGASKSDGQSAKAEQIDQPGVDRSLVRTAQLDLSARDVVATVDRARDIAATGGGYAGRESVRDESATLVLHIPSDRFDAALGELSKLGDVRSRTQSAEDVTEQIVDLQSRIATQRASVERVRALLAKATTVDEIVRIEQELTTREADLESLEQRSQSLSGQVALSTVTMQVRKSTAPPVAQEEPTGFVAGVSDGWGAFLDAGAVTLRVLGAVLPFALVLAIPAALLLRWRRRRRTPAVAQR
jgi:uncharacterized protein DUF4349